ncbi:MAG: PIG-L family deacetylase [Vulcanococcus sp.]|uniref:PIG-L deacetylase family protein n=1 Tax=Vulcanococcus sp. TaxID=2856995 RepID=UPI0025E7F702|nr:PIG-L family deacetylase [Vulcanococcus sp.]MBW0180981.1 PIG-L family deacetylase [Vulcanococcus sp.]
MKSLIIAPHPDDELLGCGGTLLKRISEGKIVGWILMTAITTEKGWSNQQVEMRDGEINRVREGLGISANHLFRLDFPAAELDQVPASTLINSLARIFRDFKPEEVFLPHPGDIHSDHRITFEAASACTKWFRYTSVKRILTYETLSETNFGFDQVVGAFQPNLFVDITNQLHQKIELLSIYQSEFAEHPFPRSLDAVRAQALLRGAQRGTPAAEAFQLLREFE